MARIARVVAPGVPHHITQRGNRRQQTFFTEDDYQAYLDLMAEWCGRFGVEIWAYCLMPNHVHLIAIPKTATALGETIGEAHRRYSRRINFREGWRGHLWQGRFASFPMDDAYLLAATRYVELNPVRARLCRTPEKYPWSSVHAHLREENDILVKAAPLLERVSNWPAFLASGLSENDADLMRKHERTGRPLGDNPFLEMLEGLLKRRLKPRKAGRKSLVKIQTD